MAMKKSELPSLWWVPIAVVLIGGVGYLIKYSLETPSSVIIRVSGCAGKATAELDSRAALVPVSPGTNMARLEGVRRGRHSLAISCEGLQTKYKEYVVRGGREEEIDIDVSGQPSLNIVVQVPPPPPPLPPPTNPCASSRVEKTESERVRIPKLGPAFGAPADPSCSSKYANCVDLVVRIPATATICAIEYFVTEEDGTGWKSTSPRSHNWFRIYEAKVEIENDMKKIVSTYKNWRRSYSREGQLRVQWVAE